MKELEIALTKFCNTLGRDGIDEGLPVFSIRQNNDYPLFVSGAVDEFYFFYDHIVFDKKIFVGGALMFAIEPLIKLQDAQYGWRNLKNIVLNPNGNQSLLQIGNRNGNAILIDIKQTYCPVYGCITGSSDVFLIASSMAKFFDVISDWLQCEYVEFNMEGYDDDGELNPAFIPRLKTLAEEKVTKEELDGFLEFFFG